MKTNYRAIKYVWDPTWIGEDAFKKEILAAKQACISDICNDWAQDQDFQPTESQIKLTAMHIAKYGRCEVSPVDRCYRKVIITVAI